MSLIRAPGLLRLGEEVAAALAYATLAVTAFHLGLRRYRRGDTAGA